MTEPTGALTFGDLIIEVAEKMGVAYYGIAGDEAAQVPTDAHDLAECKRHVNNGIRMAIADAPPSGWIWGRPVGSLTYWPTSSSLINGAPVYVSPSSTVTVHTSLFQDSMVGHNLGFTVTSTADGEPTYDSNTEKSTVNVDDAIFAVGLVGQTVTFDATGNSYTIIGYTDTTTVVVDGDASGEANADTVTIIRSYAIASVTSTLVAVVTGDASGEADGATVTVETDGNFTLPQTFGGQFTGPITFTAGTDTGGEIDWVSEAQIRRLRQNTTAETGDPTCAAIRVIPGIRRRWEMLLYPTPNDIGALKFPYELYFDELSAVADLHPAGWAFDELIKCAAFAKMEQDNDDLFGPQTQYYRTVVLPQAYSINARSAPRKLGYCGNGRAGGGGIRAFRQCSDRPTVTFNE